MLKLIDGLPAKVVGFEAIGKVEGEDYRTVLDPAIDAAVAAHGSVRVLCLLGEAYEGYSPGAMWQDAKLGLNARAHLERMAVVSDHEHLTSAVSHFAWLFPGELRTYALRDLEAATAWLSEA